MRVLYENDRYVYINTVVFNPIMFKYLLTSYIKFYIRYIEFLLKYTIYYTDMDIYGYIWIYMDIYGYNNKLLMCVYYLYNKNFKY